jgi:hypothetical protein
MVKLFHRDDEIVRRAGQRLKDNSVKIAATNLVLGTSVIATSRKLRMGESAEVASSLFGVTTGVCTKYSRMAKRLSSCVEESLSRWLLCIM